MKITELPISGLLLIEPDLFVDERGYFMEAYSVQKYDTIFLPRFVQDNESKSRKGVLRGLHYQTAPYEQGKLVRVVAGEVLDVAVDIRPNSPTFGQHYSIILSADNKKQLWIPPGFAHGFVTISDEAIFSYKCTAPYDKSSERGVAWNDEDLHIDWGTCEPLVSEKDANLPTLRQLIPSQPL